MPFPSYEFADTAAGMVDQAILFSELGAVPGLKMLTVDDDASTIGVLYDPEPSPAEKATIDGVISAHNPGLEAAKRDKIDSIDQRTADIISQGYTYKGATLSLSAAYQTNITNMMMIRNEPFMAYPIVWNNIDDTATVTTEDAGEVQNMYLAAMAAVKGTRDAGTALKDQVRSATTVAEVDAVEDNR